MSIEVQTSLNLGAVADTCRQLVPDLRYCADQYERAARALEDNRLKAAEQALIRANAGFDRVLAAMQE